MKIFHTLAICLLLLFSFPAAPRAEIQPSTDAQKSSQPLSPQEQIEHLLKIISLIKEIMPAPKESLTDVDAKTFWPSLGVFVAALLTFSGTLYTNKITLQKTKMEFAHQDAVTYLAQGKDYCIEFFNKLDIIYIEQMMYDQERIRYLVTAITIFSPENYSKFIVKLAAFLHNNPILFGKRDRFLQNSDQERQYEAKRKEFVNMYTFLIMLTNAMFAGESLDKTAMDNKDAFINRGVSSTFFD